jgi:vitamin B12 transporter
MEGANMKKIYLILIIFLTLVSFNRLIAEDIPTIVISAGKTIQSIDTVGSTIEVIDSDAINSSSYSMIGEVINDNSTSTNFFQTGGSGGNTAIQLRGLEKRYSTVYIDGVKMMDPSSPDGSFYLDNLTKNGIERVEKLKGTQSS